MALLETLRSIGGMVTPELERPRIGVSPLLASCARLCMKRPSSNIVFDLARCGRAPSPIPPSAVRARRTDDDGVPPPLLVTAMILPVDWSFFSVATT